MHSKVNVTSLGALVNVLISAMSLGFMASRALTAYSKIGKA